MGSRPGIFTESIFANWNKNMTDLPRYAHESVPVLGLMLGNLLLAVSTQSLRVIDDALFPKK